MTVCCYDVIAETAGSVAELNLMTSPFNRPCGIGELKTVGTAGATA